jgi:predicted nucleic acid-binding protein
VILVDTSVWVDHLRVGDAQLAALLNSSQVLMHPFVVGELACGNPSNRAEVLALLGQLPRAAVATNEEALFFIERHELMGRGIGYVDAHLLAAVSLDAGTQLWTRDNRLLTVAGTMKLTYDMD